MTTSTVTKTRSERVSVGVEFAGREWWALCEAAESEGLRAGEFVRRAAMSLVSGDRIAQARAAAARFAESQALVTRAARALAREREKLERERRRIVRERERVEVERDRLESVRRDLAGLRRMEPEPAIDRDARVPELVALGHDDGAIAVALSSTRLSVARVRRAAGLPANQQKGAAA